ncbi:hypothetical protein D7294_10915 [Streptomyces hoynatensis]|uniref:Secreted protein n=1 Tax=Streptomyces hoynatensis TaxID=1141874 RepID=A0A3A9Z441_9ACTN|nr:hypothetical protein D7294_10915 [Streptomyces hoynatensis]
MIIILAVVVLALLALLLAPSANPAAAGRLQRRFGPEYDRTVARHHGDTRAARKDLAERLRRHGGLHTRALGAEERERYHRRWAGVQERFVDSPGGAVAEADHVLTQLIHDRGYPADAYEERISALSVHHPRHVEGYRRVHALAGREPADGSVTEELRAAVVSARALFEDLLSPQPQDEKDRQDRPERRTARLLRPRGRGERAAASGAQARPQAGEGAAGQEATPPARDSGAGRAATGREA